MAFNAHRGTVGHTIGTSIIGKDGAGQSEPDAAHTALGFQHMHVKPAQNGIEVTHTPKSETAAGANRPAEDPAQEQLHVFRSATEAHHHIGQLLGVRLASGKQQV